VDTAAGARRRRVADPGLQVVAPVVEQRGGASKRGWGGARAWLETKRTLSGRTATPLSSHTCGVSKRN
jgi:hypothetical protein